MEGLSQQRESSGSPSRLSRRKDSSCSPLGRKIPRSQRLSHEKLQGIAIVSSDSACKNNDDGKPASPVAGVSARKTRRRISHDQSNVNDNNCPESTINGPITTTTVPSYRQSPSKYKYHTPTKAKKKKRGRLLRLVQDDVIDTLTMRDVLCKGVQEPADMARCGPTADDISTASTSRSSASGTNPQQSSDSASVITTIDSDKELELTSRQIRLELRQAEMQELLEEAERAAASGQKSFAGRTSTFGYDDPELELPPGGFKPKSTPISQRLVRRSLNFGSPLGRRILPDNASNKISVKALRDVAEVVPTFKDFHMHLRTHFLRKNVSESSLFFKEIAPSDDINKDTTVESESAPGVRTHENEQTSMQLWNSFASLSSWQLATLKTTNENDDAELNSSQQQKPADSVTESPSTNHRRGDSPSREMFGDLLAQHRQTNGQQHGVDVPSGLGLHAALKLQREGSSNRNNTTHRRRDTSNHQPAGEVRSCPTTPERGLSDPTVVDADPIPRAFSDCHQAVDRNDDVPGSPSSPILLDDLDITDVSFTPNNQEQNRVYDGPSPPPGLPLTPKENFREVFNATFTTPDDERASRGELIAAHPANRSNLGPDFVTPMRLRDIRDENLSAWPSEAFLSDTPLARSGKQRAGQPVREGTERVSINAINLQHVEDTGLRLEKHGSPFLLNGMYGMHGTSDSGILENTPFRNGNPDAYARNLMQSLQGDSPRRMDDAREVIDVEVLRNGCASAEGMYDDAEGNDKSCLPPLRTTLFPLLDNSDRGEARLPLRLNDPTEIISVEEHEHPSTGQVVVLTEIDNVKTSPCNNQGSVAGDSTMANQSKATADFPCECIISPASSLESEADDKGGRTGGWNLLEQASGESKHQSLQAAVAMFARISPSGPLNNSSNSDNGLLSSKENDEFMSNYLYCSKTSEPSDPSPPTSTPICSGAVPCQETRMPCGEIAIDSCVDSFFDAALKFLPKKSPEGSRFLSLSRDDNNVESKRSSFSWYDLANERFDLLLESIMGGEHRKGDQCRLSFQAPTLKERKAPPSSGLQYEDVSGEYDDDLGGVIFVRPSTSTSSPPRATEEQRRSRNPKAT
ncbi:expressed unknown protein [Seminavis robusta]|uniref:Uncharacterized protein n=1 Tax=Seminavis robusta TaxID=568900 RepID=A0A9N8HQC8_9STRA|nr:expressed unknown protein [Seminavis robusta]|eukprot:Sro971_g226510.1 n/a (1090) ;mRNA; f:34387-37656